MAHTEKNFQKNLNHIHSTMLLRVLYKVMCVSIIGLILFGQNHLYVKEGIPLFRRVSEDSARKSENLWFPVSRPDDRAIPSRRPSVHCSISPDNVPYHPDAR